MIKKWAEFLFKIKKKKSLDQIKVTFLKYVSICLWEKFTGVSGM